jgi:hypothetical protein
MIWLEMIFRDYYVVWRPAAWLLRAISSKRAMLPRSRMTPWFACLLDLLMRALDSPAPPVVLHCASHWMFPSDSPGRIPESPRIPGAPSLSETSRRTRTPSSKPVDSTDRSSLFCSCSDAAAAAS